MKTLYVHIGLPKTATTSIQYFCVENEEILNEKGYTYPMFERKYHRIDRRRNGAFLATRILDKNGQRNIIEEDKIFRQNMDIVIDKFQKYDNVILSDEGIWNAVFCRKTHTSLWDKLNKEAKENGFTIKIIIYLRRQDDYADSSWNQKIKLGKRISSTWSWEKFLEDVDQVISLDYYNGLKTIGDILGEENIIVRRFGRKYFKNGSVYEDFLNAIGLRYSNRFVISKYEKNTRIYGNAIEIRRMINCIPDLSLAESAFLRKICIDMSENHPEWKKFTMFSPEEAAVFVEKYREGNRKIMRKYFGRDEDLFDMDFSNKQKWIYDGKEVEQGIIEFIGRVVLETREENKNLKQKQSELEQQVKEQQDTIENMKKKLKSPIKAVLSSFKK